jgi:hypothetical protein
LRRVPEIILRADSRMGESVNYGTPFSQRLPLEDRRQALAENQVGSLAGSWGCVRSQVSSSADIEDVTIGTVDSVGAA